MRTAAAIGLSTSLLLLTGCFPFFESYYRLDQQEGKYFSGLCYGNFGPPSGVYFPFHGVHLSASVDEVPRLVLIGIHVPEGRQAQILDRTLRVTYKEPGQLESQVVSLEPARLRGGNHEPREFRLTTDPFGREDYFGVMRGETKTVKLLFDLEITGHKTYRFHAKFERQPEAGSITFPRISVDGVTYSGPNLPFKKDSRFEIYPIDC